MQKAAPAWVIVSIVIAVILWSVATMLENRLGAPQPDQPAAAPPTGEPEPAPAQLKRPGNARACATIEEDLKLVIEDSRSCAVDDDCTLFDYGYPLDCMSSVAKPQIPVLREEYRKYDEACEFRVFYDCPTEPFVRLPVCRNNRCVV